MRKRIANLQRIDHQLDLPHPWIRSQSKGTDKPLWWNPSTATKILFETGSNSKKGTWLITERIVVKNNQGRTDIIDEIQSRHASLSEAWKHYNWIRGYRV